MDANDAELAQLPREELVERARALQTVLRVASAVEAGRNVHDLAARFCEAVAAYTRFPAVVVLQYLPEQEGFEMLAQRGFDESRFPPTKVLPMQGSLTGLAAQRGVLLTTEDIAGDERVDPQTRAALTANAYTSGACVPLTHGGELLGSFNLIYPRGTTLPDGERRMLGALANSLAVAMAQRLAVARELELERQARRAQQLESLGVLAGGLAHDFNNLLMGIVGNVELARMHAEEAGQAKVVKPLSDALSAGARAAKLARQLLTFASGGSPTLKVMGDLGSMLEEVAAFAVHGTSVRCVVEVQEPLGVVEIDAGQIAQVIQNLVLNACQASPTGALVTVRARRESTGPDDARVVIQVSDHGRGIAPENLSRIFEPFFSMRAGGTGLGLAVSHSIVRRHGGHMTVESTLGEGTTFSVVLPAATGRAAVVAAPGAALAMFSGRVLVMDDDDQVRSVAAQLLRRLGFDVDEASHGEQALELGRRAVSEGRPYRVALLDLTIAGGLGGAEIADDLRRASPGIRLVVASGYAADGQDGWDARLQKPYQMLDLSQTLEAVLTKA